MVKNKTDLIKLLSEIPDPEIPVINILELGILRDAKMISENEVEVIITPTYSACPAMFNIEEDIIKLLKENNLKGKVTTQMFPIWTTDWMTDEGREKLRKYGITPPEKGAGENHLNVPKKVPAMWFGKHQGIKPIWFYTLQINLPMSRLPGTF